MIVPMKKVFILTLAKDADTTLDVLRDAGVVHIEHEKAPFGTDINTLQEQIQRLEKVVALLRDPKSGPQRTLSMDCWAAAQKILDADEEILKLGDELGKRQSQIDYWAPWGEFDPDELRDLAERGIEAGLFEIPVIDLDKIPGDAVHQVIWQTKDKCGILLISTSKHEWPWAPLTLPAQGLSMMRSRFGEIKQRVEDLKIFLKDQTVFRHAFEGFLLQEKENLRFQETLSGMGTADGLAYFKGYCPEESCHVIESLAREQRWGFHLETPSPEDRVPTLMRNPRWVEIVKPIFSLINVVPGYREIDISLALLVFFSVFFGILIGDAGYGLIFVALTWFAQIKWGHKIQDKSPFYLMYILSAGTIVWGALTGTFFGTVLFGQFIKPGMVWLTENRNVQQLCFTIGAIHLTIAHLWRFTIKLPKIAAYADLGWIFVIWSVLFKVDEMILGKVFPPVMTIVFLGGIGLILMDIVWGARDRNVLKFFGNVVINLVLSFFSMIGAFTDVVSYLRLFAVGLASVAVADAFNQMALGVGFNSVLSGMITSLILVAGHLFNIVLCGFGILVHGLRLNVLEFSGHLGLEWAGIKYEPFRKTRKPL